MFITKTWLTKNYLSPISELLPTNCGLFSCPRKSKGGGVAVIFKNSFKCRQIAGESFDSFKAMLCKVESLCSLLIAVIYRPPVLHPKGRIHLFIYLVLRPRTYSLIYLL